MSDWRSFDRRLRSFFHDRDRDRRSPFSQKVARQSRSQNSAIEIAKTAIFLAIANVANISKLCHFHVIFLLFSRNFKLAFYNDLKKCLRQGYEYQ